MNTADDATPIVELRGLGYAYHNRSEPVLGDLNVRVPAGQHVAVLGRSGCGKSTLLSLIAGLLVPTVGDAAVAGETQEAQRLRSCALMPQGDSLLPWLSLLDNVAIALRNRGVARGAARAKAMDELERWGLADESKARPARLSGGMRQRGALARALLADKPLLLADEPLGALDAITRATGQRWLKKAMADSAKTLFLVTHDVDEALLLSRQVILLANQPGLGGASIVASWAGFFDDERPRNDLLGDPSFAEARSEILTALAAGEQE